MIIENNTSYHSIFIMSLQIVLLVLYLILTVFIMSLQIVLLVLYLILRIFIMSLQIVLLVLYLILTIFINALLSICHASPMTQRLTCPGQMSTI